jgi:hypothetical protein
LSPFEIFGIFCCLLAKKNLATLILMLALDKISAEGNFPKTDFWKIESRKPFFWRNHLNLCGVPLIEILLQILAGIRQADFIFLRVPYYFMIERFTGKALRLGLYIRGINIKKNGNENHMKS